MRAKTKLGEEMYRIAREREVDGPYRIGDFVKQHSVHYKAPNRAAWSDYFHGRARPNDEHINAFIEAFGCSYDEVIRLCVYHTTGGKFVLPDFKLVAVSPKDPKPQATM